ncbi:hypothetical protein HDU67_006596 [Dinochytrium kinnereticum]|nr:hypothetical protein HDU67_006596 [Dinochytrium kinnereticum]
MVVALAGRKVLVYDIRNMGSALQEKGSSMKFMTRAVRCMPNGQGYALSSIEGRVAVEFFSQEEEDQKKKYAFKCHREKKPEGEIVHPVHALAFHPTHGTFASGGGDGVVNLWDGYNKKRLKQFPRYPTSISALAFSPDGRTLAISSSYSFEEGEKEGEVTKGLVEEHQQNFGGFFIRRSLWHELKNLFLDKDFRFLHCFWRLFRIFMKPQPAMRFHTVIHVLSSLALGQLCSAQSSNFPLRFNGGRGTYYDTSTILAGSDLGACQLHPSDIRADLIVALNQVQWAGSALCGMCVSITVPGSIKNVTAIVADMCPGCQRGALDLSQFAFEKLAPASRGVISLAWQEVPCPAPRNTVRTVGFRWIPGSTEWWFAIQPYGMSFAVERLEFFAANRWNVIPRGSNNYFIGGRLGVGPFNARVTTRDGTVMLTRVSLNVNVAKAPVTILSPVRRVNTNQRSLEVENKSHKLDECVLEATVTSVPISPFETSISIELNPEAFASRAFELAIELNDGYSFIKTFSPAELGVSKSDGLQRPIYAFRFPSGDAEKLLNLRLVHDEGIQGGMTPNETNTQAEVNEIDTVDGPLRYLGYLGRLRTVALAQSRLLAYTSEVGEAFRPVISKTFVNSAYAVSWAYVIGDVGYEAYKVQKHGGSQLDVGRTIVERGTFQSLASMILPAFTVHQIVHHSANLMRSLPKNALRSYGPTFLGLSIIPILPTLFDHPMEYASQRAFDALFPPSKAVLEVRKNNEGHQH